MTEDTRRSRRRALRWIVVLALLAWLTFGVLLRFTLRRIDTPTIAAVAPALVRNALHLVDRRPPELLERHWIVWWRHAGGDLFSRVAARPGDVVARAGERWQVRAADGGGWLLAPEVRLGADWQARELGAGEYLLLNDHVGVVWPDSRKLGVIRREAIIAHVLFAFGHS